MPELQIDRIDAEVMRIPIVGTSPLIVHRFSEKAKRQMLDNMQGRKTPKEIRDPEADYLAAFHRIKGAPAAYGFPVVGFKAATVGACRFYDKSVSMAALRQLIFFRGEIGDDGQQLARINGVPHMREDVVRLNKMGSTDLRYRPQFDEWSTTLHVVFVASSINSKSVLSLIDAGGMGVGVGEWRPEKNGDFGTYRIDPEREIEFER